MSPDCHAEGRGFESHQPLPERACKLACFSVRAARRSFRAPEDWPRTRARGGYARFETRRFAGEFRSRRTVVILRPPHKATGSDRACCVTIERDLELPLLRPRARARGCFGDAGRPEPARPDARFHWLPARCPQVVRALGDRP